MENKIKISDVLFEQKRKYNYSSENYNLEIIKHTVIKIGKKYFYTDYGSGTAFCLDTLICKSDPNYNSINDIKLWRTEQEIIDDNERIRMKSNLMYEVPRLANSLSLQQWKDIEKIINNGK